MAINDPELIYESIANSNCLYCCSLYCDYSNNQKILKSKIFQIVESYKRFDTLLQ